jgi:hypothetical protein
MTLAERRLGVRESLRFRRCMHVSGIPGLERNASLQETVVMQLPILQEIDRRFAAGFSLNLHTVEFGNAANAEHTAEL